MHRRQEARAASVDTALSDWVCRRFARTLSRGRFWKKLLETIIADLRWLLDKVPFARERGRPRHARFRYSGLRFPQPSALSGRFSIIDNIGRRPRHRICDGRGFLFMRMYPYKGHYRPVPELEHDGFLGIVNGAMTKIFCWVAGQRRLRKTVLTVGFRRGQTVAGAPDRLECTCT